MIHFPLLLFSNWVLLFWIRKFTSIFCYSLQKCALSFWCEFWISLIIYFIKTIWGVCRYRRLGWFIQYVNMSTLFSTKILRYFIEYRISCTILCSGKSLMMRDCFRILIFINYLTLINNCNSIAVNLLLWCTLTIFLFILKILIIRLMLQCSKCILNCWIMIIIWFTRKIID